MGSKTGNMPAPDPSLTASEVNMNNQATAYMGQIAANSQAMLPLQQQQMQLGLQAEQTAYNQSQTQYQEGQQQYSQLQGLLGLVLSQAQQYNSPEYQAQLQGQAAAGVGSAYNAMQGANARSEGRMGVTVGSGMSQALSNQNAMSQAASLSSASWQVANAARQEGYNLTDRALGAYSNAPGLVASSTAAGAGYGSAGVGLSSAALAGMNQGFGMAGNMATQIGANYGSLYGTEGSLYNQANQIASQSNPMNTMLGAAAGAGMAYLTGGTSLFATGGAGAMGLGGMKY